MKYAVLIVFWTLLPDAEVFGQASNREFGVVPLETFDMQVYDKDPEASAVVLFDIGEARFNDDHNGFKLSVKRTKRIRILKDDAMDYVTVVNIPYWKDGGNTEKVTRIQAFTYNLQNGIVTKVAIEPTQIYEERITDNVHNKTFTFPRVKSGSVIEYQYEFESPFMFNLTDWEFQSSYPTIYSSFIVNMIPFYEYTFILQGADRFSEYSAVESTERRYFGGVSFTGIVHTYVMKDVPAFQDEGFITSPGDYILKMDFQLSKITYTTGGSKEILTTWPKLIDELQKGQFFGRYIAKAKREAESILAALNVQTLPESERIKAIVDYVKHNYQWNGNSRYGASLDPKDFITHRNGSSAEINLFLVALLEVAGIQAYPVLTSTRDHGKIKADYPFEHFFNYVLVAAHDGTGLVLTDGTDPLLAYNRIPVRCINEKGLIVKEDSEDWVGLESNIESLEHVAIGMQCDLDKDLINVSLKQRTTEYEAHANRLARQDTNDIIDKLRARDFVEVRNVQIQNADKVEKAYVTSAKGAVPLQRINEEIVIKPFLDYPIAENPFKQRSRAYPIDFIFKKSKQYLCVLDIPTGYTVSESPSPLQVDDQLVRLEYLTETVGDKFKVTGTVTFKHAVYPAAEYLLLKSHFDTMIAKFQEVVILNPL
jgi:hypothetical protein